MLLVEVLDKTSSKIKSTDKPITGLLKHDNQTVIGSGIQAIAYLHKKFPGKIIKTIQISGPEDPSYQFLRLALNHQDNPYFPRIYSVKKYTTKQVMEIKRQLQFRGLGAFLMGAGNYLPKQKKYTLIVVMEPLKEERITDAEVKLLGIPNNMLPRERKKIKPGLMPEYLIRMAFYDPGQRKHTINYVKDPTLKQALRLLEPLFRHYQPDMHGGNILKRSDGHLVFADPVAP